MYVCFYSISKVMFLLLMLFSCDNTPLRSCHPEAPSIPVHFS